MGEEAQECRNWGPQQDLFNYSAPFRKVPQFLTTFASYDRPLPDQHPYGAGNDALEIQFGAIFPKETRNPNARPAPFGKDTRRILINRGPAVNSQVSNPGARGVAPRTLGPKVFKLDQLPSFTGISRRSIYGQNLASTSTKGTSIKFSESSTQAVIRAAYLQVFGREVYSGQRLSVAEIKLENGEITVREFVRQLAKSNVFRSLYWTPLYVMKAVEYIHRRLLGRPTYGRQETNKYFDISSKKGFYGLIDAIIDGPEYAEAFGEDTVPYERYVTPAGLSLRMMRVGSSSDKSAKVELATTPRFVELGLVAETRTAPDVQFRINQGVSKKREQTKTFKLTGLEDKANLKIVIGAAYRQIFERDIAPYIVKNEFTVLETKLSNGDITVKEFIEGLGTSSLYTREFYTPYPNTKVIELGTKHFLGRAPLDQIEIRKYNQILATQGLRGFIGAMVNSLEYVQAFGEDTVPFNRFLTLPAANYPNTQRLYNKLTKQDSELVVPSFEAAEPRLDSSKLPLTGKAIADLEAEARKAKAEEPAYVGLGRSSSGAVQSGGSGVAAQKPARIYRLTPSMTSSEADQVIEAIYSQIMDASTGQIPDYFRQPNLENQLKSGTISVREFVRVLAGSDVYRDRFYTPYPPNKTIEFLFRHLLGRTPSTQAEIHQYNKLLADSGLKAVVDSLVDSAEYAIYFAEDTVPYKRVPTLPTGNYLGSVKVDANVAK